MPSTLRIIGWIHALSMAGVYEEMMKRNDECECKHMERVDRTLDDGFSYHYFQCPTCGRIEYPPCEAQKLLDHSREHLFMYIDDWILLWMYVGNGDSVHMITELQKDMPMVLRGFAQRNNITSESLGFEEYESRTYAGRIERCIDTLTKMGFVTSHSRINSESERLLLTESGTKVASEISKKLTEEQLESLRRLRRRFQYIEQEGLNGSE